MMKKIVFLLSSLMLLTSCSIQIVYVGSSSVPSSVLVSSEPVHPISSDSLRPITSETSDNTDTSSDITFLTSYSDSASYWSNYTNGSYTDNYIDYGPSCQYRLEAKPVLSSDGMSATTYRFDEATLTATPDITLAKDGIYTDPDLVALYYIAFETFPKNYGYYYTNETTNPSVTSSDRSSAVFSRVYAEYGEDARLVTDYHRTTGYSALQPTLNGIADSDFTYYELDWALNSSYYAGGNLSRGAGRIIIWPRGASAYGTGENEQPYIVKTLDHYAHFREFGNFVGGWGKNFDGQKPSFSLGVYSPLTTYTA